MQDLLSLSKDLTFSMYVGARLEPSSDSLYINFGVLFCKASGIYCQTMHISSYVQQVDIPVVIS